MTAKNRATLINKLHTTLKKHFKPAPPSPGRPLMEHVLYASLLEDTPADLADEGFAKCEQEFFDWNEVRVTTATELSEVLSRLPSPMAAAVRLKKNLQSMFETFYNFDIDYLKKENLGKAVAKFESMPGMTPFVLSYLIQHGLGGHSIPVDGSAMKILWLSGIVSDAEAAAGRVPGLERTITKNRAIEFSSLLHQAGVALQLNPKDKSVWDVLLAVNKNAKALFDRPPVPTGTLSSKSARRAVSSPGSSASAASASTATAKQDGAAATAAVTQRDDATAAKSKSKSSQRKATAGPAAAKPSPVTPAKSAKSAAAASSATPSASKSKRGTSADVKARVPKPTVKSASGKKPRSEKREPAKKSETKAASESTKKRTAKKPASSKSASAKATAKSGAEKEGSKRGSKKSAGTKPASGKKVASSANKKLTKQKPR